MREMLWRNPWHWVPRSSKTCWTDTWDSGSGRKRTFDILMSAINENNPNIFLFQIQIWQRWIRFVTWPQWIALYWTVRSIKLAGHCRTANETDEVNSQAISVSNLNWSTFICSFQVHRFHGHQRHFSEIRCTMYFAGRVQFPTRNSFKFTRAESWGCSTTTSNIGSV